MDYEEALSFIHGTLKFGSKLGLHNIGMLLELMDNPQKKLRYVHVAGTNGKGSTVAFISSVLMEAGYKTGIYISPYIERFTERIRINNDEIPEEDLARITAFVKEKVDVMLARGFNHPTEFEIVTAIAFQYYYEKSCDVVVLEVGLGGRFDSTNIIESPLISVITTISYDHTERLGNTLAKIAFEKAGIIKDGCDTVIFPQTEEADEVFERVCRERNSRLHRVDFSALQPVRFGIEGQEFNFEGYSGLTITLLGDHQIKNAAVAVKACEVLGTKGLVITERMIREGLLKAKWPGRLEVLKKSPVFLIDGAHNIEGASALASALRKYFPGKRKIFITGVLRDKDYKSMIEAVADQADSFITVTPASERALPAGELAQFISRYCKNVTISDKISSAIETSLCMASPDDVICSFGSLYYIGEVRSQLRKEVL